MNVTNLTIDGSSSKTKGYCVLVEHRKTASLTKTQQLIIIIWDFFFFEKSKKKKERKRNIVAYYKDRSQFSFKLKLAIAF